VHIDNDGAVPVAHSGFCELKTFGKTTMGAALPFVLLT
jgi:hypothetical protein